MHARVATFDGGEPQKIREMVADIRQKSESGPPEGVDSVGFLMLAAPDAGKVLAIGLFETEEKLHAGDAVLNSMDPPVEGGMGQRTSVDFYEVGLKIDS